MKPSPDISQVALITGASGGLGTVVTQQFLEAGHRVCAVAPDWPRPLPQRDSCMTLQADLRDPTAAESAVRAAVERWGAVDFLVHLVGAYRSGMRLEDTSDEFWDELLDVNLRTAVNVMRAVIPSMRQQRSGRITVVGATTALQPVVTWSAFCSSVAALCEVVRVAAAGLRDEGITVNAILPSTIATTFVREKYGEVEAHKWVDPRSIRLADALAFL